MAALIDGKAISAVIRGEIKDACAKMAAEHDGFVRAPIPPPLLRGAGGAGAACRAGGPLGLTAGGARRRRRAWRS